MTAPPIPDRHALIEAVRHGVRPKYLFFWGHTPNRPGEIGKHCLSQWCPAAFTVDGVTYPTAEHFMMAEKARLFGDREALSRILSAASPAAAASDLGAKDTPSPDATARPPFSHAFTRSWAFIGPSILSQSSGPADRRLSRARASR